MKISKNWLKDYIEIPFSDDELAEKLSLSGTSVEAVEKGIDENVIVVEIKNITPHPDADRLRLATIFDGTEELTVVCGAPNIEVGQKVPLAKIGAVLPGGVIEKAKIRGVESSGMLCAPDELGLGHDHSGIYILPTDFVVGLPLSEYLGNDTVFDLEITPNRGDCLSHIGISREIAAMTDQTITKKPIEMTKSSKKAGELLKVEVRDVLLCPQYQARVIKDVKIGESPDWLKDRLIAIGAKPINNVVDATNFVMYDLGQPLHAFDLSKVKNKQIIVRSAKSGEMIRTLDGIERKLDSKDLVIADSEKPIAVAGVMGGENSEISSTTKSIVLESAQFESKIIRKTAKTLSLSSDASYRFERGIDPATVEYALNKAAKLIAEIASGSVLSGIVRITNPLTQSELTIPYQKINNLLGLDLTNIEINQILKSLGFEIKDGKCKVPAWRHDISLWQDLAEEVGRIYGYDKIIPIPVPKTEKPKKSEFYYAQLVKDILSDAGFVETYNYAFLSEDDTKAAKLKATQLLEVANPLQSDIKYLRSSLIPGLLRVIAKNPAFDQTLVFEIGNVFAKDSETKMLGMAAAGKNAKQILENAIANLSEKAGIPAKSFVVSELSRDDLVRFKIKKPVVYVVEVALSDFAGKFLKNNQPEIKMIKKNIHYRPISKYPSVTRDLAFIVDKKTKALEIEEEIYEISDEIARVELFDEFVSDKFGKDKKNIAFHVNLQAADRTLTDAEANKIIDKVTQTIEKQYNAKLRTE